MWQLQYSYDGQQVGDLYPISQGFTGTIERNSVGQITFQTSLRKAYEFCETNNFDTTRFFTPIRSTIKIVSPDGKNVMGGWLSATPSFDYGSQADTTVQYTFVSYLGLCAGAYLIPPLSYNNRFDIVAKQQIDKIIERTRIAGRKWPIRTGISDSLPVVSDVLEAPKTLKDFLLERTDNQTGTGNFDVYADPTGQITLHTRYGRDLSESLKLVYPDDGTKYGIKNISFPQWDNYISDMFLTGAGNGYTTVSGAEGTAIFSTSRNQNTIDNIGYWQHASSESDISTQTVLASKATSYTANTDKPFGSPTLKIDGDQYRIYDHLQDGEIWLGDTITVMMVGWASDMLPIVTPAQLRINSLTIEVDLIGHCELQLGLTDV